MKNFVIEDLPLEGLKLITNNVNQDSRGFLSRIFCFDELKNSGWNKHIQQINHTYTKKKGTIRGLHYQEAPFCEMKLINCIRGKILDVAVDLRPDSDTYLKYFTTTLSEENNNAFLIPEGFAHGFQTLTDNVEMIYFHSIKYNKDYERGFHPLDPKIGIKWPEKISEISDRDSNHSYLDNFFKGVKL